MITDTRVAPDPGSGTPVSHGIDRARRKSPWGALVAGLIGLVGLLVLLYPSTAAWWSQYTESQVIQQLSGSSEGTPRNALDGELQRARAYNSALVGGALLAPNTNVPTGTGVEGGPDPYPDLLRADADGAMGRLRIPAIAVDLPIYHGTSDDTLARGVGHLEGTSLPVGGASQHSVLTAHRGLASSELFTNLDRLKAGDTFTIEVFGEVLSYRVFDTRVVDPSETRTLAPVYGKDLVTLVTCTPLGINTQRILVTGERITPTPAADLARAGARPDVPGFPWWAAGLLLGLAIIGGYLWSVLRGGRGRRPSHAHSLAEGDGPEDRANAELARSRTSVGGRSRASGR